ncbi:centromere protein K isoform X2 [Macaca nemestrina]|uniref:centromere protein K isoform X2 n=1 Tax=Macaca fascicularis TaxID=9541 RepID=UPI0032B032A8
MNKMQYILTVAHYWTIKRNEVQVHAKIWMYLENMLSETSQSQRTAVLVCFLLLLQSITDWFQKLRQDLEMVLSTMESKNEKLKEDLEREQRWLDEQQQIMESLNVLHSELKNKVETFSESRIFNELKTKMLNVKEYKEKLLSTLGKFLEDHFPLPDRSVKKKKKNIQESTVQLITLHEMLEILINRLFDVPHDPYVKISDSFWPPYVELLLRNGIALRHPEDPTRIRLEAFHQ